MQKLNKKTAFHPLPYGRGLPGGIIKKERPIGRSRNVLTQAGSHRLTAGSD